MMVIKKSNETVRKALRLALLMIFPLLSPLGYSQSVTEYSQPYRWWSNKGSFSDQFDDVCVLFVLGICANWENYGSALPDVASTYLGPTNLEAGIGPNDEGYIYFWNANYGVQDFVAYTNTWSGPSICVGQFTQIPNGNCNTTTARADYADIVVNDWYYEGSFYNLITMTDRNLKHEVGHALGMAHSPYLSFMRAYLYQDNPYILQGWEVSWINSNYP